MDFQIKGMFLIVLASLLAAGPVLAQVEPPAHAVVADTQSAARKQGMVPMGKTLWKCSDRRCTLRSGRVAVNVDNCQALAELVGPIARFGRSAQTLPPYDLAVCNVRAQINLARKEEARRAANARDLPGNSASPREARAPHIPPVVQGPGLGAASSTPTINVRVESLSVIGTSSAQVAHAQTPSPSVRIDVGPLAVVGQGRLQELREGIHLTVSVEKLEVVGQ